MTTLYRWEGELLRVGAMLAIDERCCCEEPVPDACYVCHPCLTVYIEVPGQGECLGEMPLILAHNCYNNYDAALPASIPIRNDGVFVGTAHPAVLWVKGRMYFYLTLVISGNTYYGYWTPKGGLADDPPTDCLELYVESSMRCTVPGGSGPIITCLMGVQTATGLCNIARAMGGANLNDYTAQGLVDPGTPCSVFSQADLTRTGPPNVWQEINTPYDVTLGHISTPPCGYYLLVECNDPPGAWIRYEKVTCGGPTGYYQYHSAQVPIPVPTPPDVLVTIP